MKKFSVMVLSFLFLNVLLLCDVYAVDNFKAIDNKEYNNYISEARHHLDLVKGYFDGRDSIIENVCPVSLKCEFYSHMAKYVSENLAEFESAMVKAARFAGILDDEGKVEKQSLPGDCYDVNSHFDQISLRLEAVSFYHDLIIIGEIVRTNSSCQDEEPTNNGLKLLKVLQDFKNRLDKFYVFNFVDRNNPKLRKKLYRLNRVWEYLITSMENVRLDK